MRTSLLQDKQTHKIVTLKMLNADLFNMAIMYSDVKIAPLVVAIRNQMLFHPFTQH